MTKGKQSNDRRDPVYTVGRVVRHASGDVERIEVTAAAVSAKTQEKACDEAVGRLPVEQRNGEFGAFLAGSLKTFDYEAEQTVVTRKKPHADLVSAAPPDSFGPED